MKIAKKSILIIGLIIIVVCVGLIYYFRFLDTKSPKYFSACVRVISIYMPDGGSIGYQFTPLQTVDNTLIISSILGKDVIIKDGVPTRDGHGFGIGGSDKVTQKLSNAISLGLYSNTNLLILNPRISSTTQTLILEDFDSVEKGSEKCNN